MRQQVIFNPIKETKHRPLKSPYVLCIGIVWYGSTIQEDWKLQNICNEIGFLWKTDESLTAND